MRGTCLNSNIKTAQNQEPKRSGGRLSATLIELVLLLHFEDLFEICSQVAWTARLGCYRECNLDTSTDARPLPASLLVL